MISIMTDNEKFLLAFLLLIALILWMPGCTILPTLKHPRSGSYADSMGVESVELKRL